MEPFRTFLLGFGYDLEPRVTQKAPIGGFFCLGCCGRFAQTACQQWEQANAGESLTRNRPRPLNLSDALGTPGAMPWGTSRVKRATGPLRYALPPGEAACRERPATPQGLQTVQIRCALANAARQLRLFSRPRQPRAFQEPWPTQARQFSELPIRQ